MISSLFSRLPPFATQILQELGLVLILIPVGVWNPDLSLRSGGTAFLCATLAFVVQHQVRSFFAPPRWMRWVLLPALVSAPPFSLLCLPQPLAVLLPLFALAWVLDASRILSVPWWGRLLLLSLVALRLLNLAAPLPVFDFPRLPTSTPVWIGIALVVPLGIATQVRLRRFARNVILAELTLVFLALSLIPLVIQTLTGFKEVGEPERNFFSLRPLPGFRSVPDFGSEKLYPSELRNFPDPLQAIGILDDMNLALQPDQLAGLEGDLPQEQTLFLLQQTGFLRKDRYGFFVPPQVYGDPELPEGTDPAFLDVVRRLARFTSLNSDDSSRPTLLRLRKLNLVDSVPGDSSRFRLTPQARQPFANGLYPRQIRFAASLSPDPPPGRIHHADYAATWNLGFDRSRLELMDLVDAGVLEIDSSLSWQTDAFAGITFPSGFPVTGVLFPLLGVVLLWLSSPSLAAQVLRLACFAAGMNIVAVFPALPGAEFPLVYQAVLTTTLLPPATLLVAAALFLRDPKE